MAMNLFWEPLFTGVDAETSVSALTSVVGSRNNRGSCPSDNPSGETDRGRETIGSVFQQPVDEVALEQQS
jgi:hypothetical protein